MPAKKKLIILIPFELLKLRLLLDIEIVEKKLEKQMAELAAEKDAKIEEKDVAINEKKAEIAALKSELEKLKKDTGSVLFI